MGVELLWLWLLLLLFEVRFALVLARISEKPPSPSHTNLNINKPQTTNHNPQPTTHKHHQAATSQRKVNIILKAPCFRISLCTLVEQKSKNQCWLPPRNRSQGIKSPPIATLREIAILAYTSNLEIAEYIESKCDGLLNAEASKPPGNFDSYSKSCSRALNTMNKGMKSSH